MDRLMQDSSQDYRHELKYFITPVQATELTARLCQVMKFDRYSVERGNYLISSVYFDTPENRSLAGTEAGLLKRKKYRIRAYNHSDSFISLERKTKRGTLGKKESVRITRRIYDDIMYRRGESLLTLDSDLAHEFYHMLNVEGYRPKTVVEYNRRAFVADASNVRITLDSNIKGSGAGVDMFVDSGSLVYTVPPCWVVLEVKYDHFLPDYIRNLLPDDSVMQSACSKYVFGRTFT
ncbi:MAG: polyphosphate polymerase domain-containing protein [Clostridia bacterium]|nr:polyphosphate polymerase domain-containing protein [Clostridia bacterium]